MDRIGWRAEALPGLGLAIVLGAAGVIIAELETRILGHQLLEALVLALLLGVIVRNTIGRTHLLALGAAFASKQLLEVGIALLGAGVDLHQILAAGTALLLVVLAGVGGALTVGYFVGRLLGLPVKLAVLTAVGNAICGNSAIAAVSAVIRADKRDVASAIALTAVLGVCVVLLLPALIPLAGLDHYQYGVLAGMNVYAVPQVIAAAFPVSELSGQVATLVKLSRVALLGPLVLLFGVMFRTGDGSRQSVLSYLPWFLVVFLTLALLRSLGMTPLSLLAEPAREASRALTIVAMAGLGYGVELAAVRTVGLRVGLTVVASLVFLCVLTIALIRTLGIA